MKSLGTIALAICGASGIAGMITSAGAAVVYTVDPALSSLTVSGTYNGSPMKAQGFLPSSLVTSYTGTITANRDAAADTLQITGGTVTGQTSGAYLPDGTGQYGVVIQYGTAPLPVTNEAEVSGFSFALSSGTINSPESFDSSLLSAAITGGFLGGDATAAGGTVHGPYTGTPATSFTIASGNATLADAAGAETLTIPINTDLVFNLSFGTTMTMHLSGNIVAETPEPASIGAVSGIALLLLRRRKRL